MLIVLVKCVRLAGTSLCRRRLPPPLFRANHPSVAQHSAAAARECDSRPIDTGDRGNEGHACAALMQRRTAAALKPAAARCLPLPASSCRPRPSNPSLLRPATTARDNATLSCLLVWLEQELQLWARSGRAAALTDPASPEAAHPARSRRSAAVSGCCVLPFFLLFRISVEQSTECRKG